MASIALYSLPVTRPGKDRFCAATACRVAPNATSDMVGSIAGVEFDRNAQMVWLVCLIAIGFGERAARRSGAQLQAERSEGGAAFGVAAIEIGADLAARCRGGF